MDLLLASHGNPAMQPDITVYLYPQDSSKFSGEGRRMFFNSPLEHFLDLSQDFQA